MPIEFDNRISWMDIGSLVTATTLVASAFFALNGDQQVTESRVNRAEQDIVIVRSEVKAVAEKSDARMSMLSQQMERNRLEQKSDNQRLEAKLDKLVEAVVNK